MIEEGRELVNLEMSDDLAKDLSDRLYSEVTENGGHLFVALFTKNKNFVAEVHADGDELVSLIIQLLNDLPELQEPVSKFLGDMMAKSQATIQ